MRFQRPFCPSVKILKKWPAKEKVCPGVLKLGGGKGFSRGHKQLGANWIASCNDKFFSFYLQFKTKLEILDTDGK